MLRAVEEAAFAEAELARRPARSRGPAAVGAITVSDGRVRGGRRRRARRLHRRGAPSRCSTRPTPAAFVELVAAESGRIGALLPGSCRTRSSRRSRRPASSCCRTAASWARPARATPGSDPCPHALAVLTQLAWLIQADPFVLFHLRGLARDGCCATSTGWPPRGEAPRTLSPGTTRRPAARRRRRPGRRRGRRASARPGSAAGRARSTPGEARRAGSGEPEGAVAMSRSTSCICGSGSRPLCGVELSSPNSRVGASAARPRGLRVGVVAAQLRGPHVDVRALQGADPLAGLVGQAAQSRSWTTISARCSRANSMCHSTSASSASRGLVGGRDPRAPSARSVSLMDTSISASTASLDAKCL